ncbi:MAG TPA: hypothetical protein VGR63_18915, partial [Casimicrobiaceae bacterium]|nr:hypothetical protein [Casimicrobiaceae bacterium]
DDGGLGIWGGAPPYVDIGGPGPQPHPGHPIAPGGRPPGIWGGAPSYPDQGLPPGGGHPSQPIYHPGHPDHGLPSQPPGIWPSPGHPDQGLPPGGQPVPPEVWPKPPAPPLPPELESQVVVAVHKPGQDWVVKSYPVGPDQGLPPGQPHPSHPIAPGGSAPTPTPQRR